MPDTSLIPQEGDSEVVRVLKELRDKAEERVKAELGKKKAGEMEIEARIDFYMLQEGENNRAVQRAAQGAVVAFVARNQLYLHHPDDYARISLRCFLRSTGMGDSTVSDLTALGDKIVPFCDHHDLPIDAALTPGEWPKLREAIPAMRQAAKEDKPSTAKRILKDVEKAVNRDAVRMRYRTHRERIGHAVMNDLPDDRVLLVAVIDDPDAAKAIALSLGGKLQWDLLTNSPKITKTKATVEVILPDESGDSK